MVVGLHGNFDIGIAGNARYYFILGDYAMLSCYLVAGKINYIVYVFKHSIIPLSNH